MFSKILIANRGEIACRIIRTARRMGIMTVAVYSEADADALHVREADEAVLIGPPPAALSYLRIDAIVKACKDTGAEAVHPGYGFLSENPAFPKALGKAKIAFIGPPAKAIAAMGDKIAAKKLAEKIGINTIPGHLDAIADVASAVKIARRVGYPVMVKAAAGGGGKGMRVARNDAEVREGFRLAAGEAKASFGDDRLFIERYIEEPRHIEIQVLGDRNGNIIHLGERECSIQRRHQKVIEEAPSPFIDAATRDAMGQQAVALARAVGYTSAGTVEFVVDQSGRVYFLEMNTRLQVEHPVTEAVTGLDLVEIMIRIAAGENLPLRQKDVRLTGWAIEARLCAEDPLRNFLPSIGRLTHYRPPQDIEGIRIDSGVVEGGDIGIHYDPMIAKLIAFGRSRGQAIARLRGALDAFHIRGISHNLSFLAATVATRRFASGRLSTNFIDEEFPGGFSGVRPSVELTRQLLALAAAIHRQCIEREASIDGQLVGHGPKIPEDWVAVLGDGQRSLSVAPVPEGFDVAMDDRVFTVRGHWTFGSPLFSASVDGDMMTVQVQRRRIGYRLLHGGVEFDVMLFPERTAELWRLMPKKRGRDTTQFLLSPMPGLLKAVAVKPGQDVKAGEELAVVEAMKMENILRSDRDGRIARIHAQPGASLAVDQPILEFA
ncbi:MAG: acetyl/propionyl/methylcrotonyl-CoA carboxylase subunit alpha [Rhodospirillaceae bacterium]|nr:acetyl/propionyl/methylcrotonyl-CoA carboxylase subunit alpha [Rhodospirillaceae bacterium]